MAMPYDAGRNSLTERAVAERSANRAANKNIRNEARLRELEKRIAALEKRVAVLETWKVDVEEVDQRVDW